MHNAKTTTAWSGERMTSFKILLSVHSCIDVQQGEENVKYLSKQYPIVEIQMRVSILFRLVLESSGFSVSRR